MWNYYGLSIFIKYFKKRIEKITILLKFIFIIKGPFFRNFGSISVYAIFGTIIATIITAFFIWFVGYIGVSNVK